MSETTTIPSANVQTTENDATNDTSESAVAYLPKQEQDTPQHTQMSPICPPASEPLIEQDEFLLQAGPFTQEIKKERSDEKYQCDCGKTFTSSQAKAGHCHFCVIHQANKHQRGMPSLISQMYLKRKRDNDYNDEENTADSSSAQSHKRQVRMAKPITVQRPLPTKSSVISALLSDDDENALHCSPAIRVGSTPLSPSFGSAVLAPQSCCVDTWSPRRVVGTMEKINLDDEVKPRESPSLFCNIKILASTLLTKSQTLERENTMLEVANAKIEERLKYMRQQLLFI